MDLSMRHGEIDAIERNGCAELLVNPLGAECELRHRSMRNESNLHLLVGESAAIDDHVVVERNGAVAHGDVIVALGRTLAAALRIRSRGEQKIAGKAAGTSMVAHRIGAIERNGVPAALGVESPSQMRDGMPV